MRISNFSILTGPKVTVSDITAGTELVSTIASGSIGTEVSDLDRGGNNRFYGFMTHYGEGDDEGAVDSPYGNVNVFNVGRINSGSLLAITGSIGHPIGPYGAKGFVTGSAKASFLFVVEKSFRG